jgi:alpha/beta superfamily hydrolase
MARLLESTFLQGPAGRLEALHEAPEGAESASRAVVVCHPHPLFGGTMHNKVVFRLARAARRSGAAVLRFNFRGVGQSDGAHDEGNGEQDDLRAALGYLNDRYPGLPLAAGGFSFGARIALQVCCGDARVDRVVAAGVPVNRGDWTFLRHCGCPKFFLHSTHDEHGSRESMEKAFTTAASPKRLIWIEAADHFFADSLEDVEEEARKAWSAPLP